MYAYIQCVPYLLRPEKGVTSPKAGATGACELRCCGTKPRSSAVAASALNPRSPAISPAPPCSINKHSQASSDSKLGEGGPHEGTGTEEWLLLSPPDSRSSTTASKPYTWKWAGQMAQWRRIPALAAVPEDLGLIPSTHWLTAV